MPNALAMTTYLLPCVCSARIEVGVGQAGGHVVCPACGVRVDVPTLRGLRRLEIAGTQAAAPAVRWNWRHASLFGGLALVVASAAAAFLLTSPTRASIDTETIREAVMTADDRSVIEFWKAVSMSGVARPPTPEEASLQQTVLFRRRMATGIGAVGAIGALAMLAGGCAAALERRRRR